MGGAQQAGMAAMNAVEIAQRDGGAARVFGQALPSVVDTHLQSHRGGRFLAGSADANQPVARGIPTSHTTGVMIHTDLGTAKDLLRGGTNRPPDTAVSGMSLRR